MSEPRLVLGILNMVFSTPEWVHRRVEQVELVTATHYRRRVSLDFTSPELPITDIPWLGERRMTLVPVDILAKRSLQTFSIVDADGRALSVLTRRQNGAVAFGALRAFAAEILNSAGHDQLTDDLVASCRRIAQGTVDDATEAIRELRESADTDEPSGVLVQDDGFITCAEMLAANFLLIAMIPVSPGARQILKFSHEESMTSPVDERSKRQQLLESIGWSPTTFELSVPSFADCETYHFEVSAPEGIELIDVVLGDEHRSRRNPQGEVDEQWALGYTRVLETSPHRAHLSTSRTSDGSAKHDEFLSPSVSVRLRVERDGWLRSSALAALFVAVFLSASWHYVASLDDRSPARVQCVATTPAQVRDPAFAAEPLCDSRERLNTDPAAFAVALLGVITLAVIRVGEHAYTARLLRRLRVAALMAAVLPIAAAWLLVFPGPGRVLSDGWGVLVGVSWFLTAGLSLVWLKAPTE